MDDLQLLFDNGCVMLVQIQEQNIYSGLNVPYQRNRPGSGRSRCIRIRDSDKGKRCERRGCGGGNKMEAVDLLWSDLK